MASGRTLTTVYSGAETLKRTGLASLQRGSAGCSLRGPRARRVTEVLTGPPAFSSPLFSSL